MEMRPREKERTQWVEENQLIIGNFPNIPPPFFCEFENIYVPYQDLGEKPELNFFLNVSRFTVENDENIRIM